MEFIYLFRVLLKRKWIIIGSAILAAAIAYFLTRNQPRKYRSIAQVSTGFTVSDEIKINSENFDIYEADTKFNNVIVTATSPTVLNLLSYRLILHDLEDPKPFRELTEEQKRTAIYKQTNLATAKQVFQQKWSTMSMLTSFNPAEKKLIEFLKLYRYDQKNLEKSLNVYRLQRTDYFQIDFISEQPELSAFVVNNLFQEFIRYYKNVRSTNSEESLDTLKSIVDKKKQELDIKNALLRNAGVIDASNESISTLDLIRELEKSRQEEQSKKTLKEFELKKVNSKLTNSSSVVNETDNEEIVLARNAKNEAYKNYTNNPTDKNLYNKYLQLKQDYDTKLQNLIASRTTSTTTESKADLVSRKNELELDLQAIDENIKSYDNKISSLKGDISSISSRGAAVQTLISDRDLAEKEYMDAKKKYNDAIDMSASSVNNFRQTLVGQPALEPEPSKRKLIIGMAGMATFLTSILVIVILAFLDSSVKTPLIFSKKVNLKLISIVNFMNLKNMNVASIILNKTPIHDRAEKKRQIIFKESIRKLRYEIENSGKKIFLFTSTKKGEGKTTLIQALAYSLSLSKKKILIIDTNFCNNDLTVQLQAEPILEKLAVAMKDDNNARTLERIKKATKNIGTGTVFAIGSEGGDYTPEEIFSDWNILDHLQTLALEYDYIILEGPPLNDFADSKELAEYADGVIAVFSANRNIKQIDKESVRFYTDLNGKFIGSILNKVDLKNIDVTA